MLCLSAEETNPQVLLPLKVRFEDGVKLAQAQILPLIDLRLDDPKGLSQIGDPHEGTLNPIVACPAVVNVGTPDNTVVGEE